MLQQGGLHSYLPHVILGKRQWTWMTESSAEVREHKTWALPQHSVLHCYLSLGGKKQTRLMNSFPRSSFLSSGQPKYVHAAYQLLAGKRTNFPHNVHLLNIIGNLDDGTNSDSLVTNVSARSIKPLLRGTNVNYTEKVFHGKTAQHSQLHENAAVALAVDRYLWHR